MKYRWVYALISGVVIAAGIFGLVRWGLVFGVDFTGGTLAEYKFEKAPSEDTATKAIEGAGLKVFSVQKTDQNTYLFRLPAASPDDKNKINKNLADTSGGKVDELRFETVGPTIGPELIRKTIYAMVIGALGILFWVAFQFKSLKFGTSAVLAMLHDTIVVIGVYSLFVHFFGAEVDFLFVTALLTILSFSVHDTIIVYDRIRESQRKFGGTIYDLANKATTETMVRSFNNSMTIVFMLVALVLLGGSSIKWFAAALLVGTISGTYSSPFVAVSILVTWDELQKKLRR